MGIMDHNNAHPLIFPHLAGNALRVYARGYSNRLDGHIKTLGIYYSLQYIKG